MASSTSRHVRARALRAPIVWLCVGAILSAATPAFCDPIAANTYNTWQWNNYSWSPRPPAAAAVVPVNQAAAVPPSSPLAALTYSELTGAGFGIGTASLSGVVYYDANGNGAVDAMDWGIAEARILLSLAGSDEPAITISTASDGTFQFAALPAGEYTLTMLTECSKPGTDLLGAVRDKDGQYLSANSGTVSPDTFSNIILEDGFSGTNYAFGELSYPIATISKRLMLNNDPGLVHTSAFEPVPEPSAIALLAVAALVVGGGACRRRMGPRL